MLRSVMITFAIPAQVATTFTATTLVKSLFIVILEAVLRTFVHHGRGLSVMGSATAVLHHLVDRGWEKQVDAGAGHEDGSEDDKGP